MGLMGGGNAEFTFKSLIFAMVIVVLMSTAISVLIPTYELGANEDEVLDGYYQMTGQTASTKVSVWPLTGIYTPYAGGTYGYTEDGWLYGTEVKTYTPSQYSDGPQKYTVYKDDAGVFRYYTDSADYNEETGTGHRGTYYYDDQNNLVKRDNPGELYNSVSFDLQQRSNVFFMESSRTDTDDGYFYYDYDGYRMAFQPISNYTALDQDGNSVPIVATTTSLSLIWYQYYTQSGVAGQLVLSGSSGGLAYLNAAQILAAFNNTNNTASFDMVFNGITMTVYIKIDPMYLSQGNTVEYCYNMGWWSIMVTSLSADSSAYTGTDFAFNPSKIMDTMIDLFTFNYEKYGISGWMAVVCSFVYALPLYAILLSLCLENTYLWILMGLLAAVQAISTFSLFG